MQGDTRPSWMEERRRGDVDVWKIAAGVALGILVAGAIGYFVRLWFISQALSGFNQSMSAIVRQSNEQAAQERQRQEQIRAIAAQRDWERRQQEAEIQRAREATIQQAQERQSAKESAWSRYYRKPAACENADGQAFVDCANQHIRAKRQFEQLWAAGKL